MAVGCHLNFPQFIIKKKFLKTLKFFKLNFYIIVFIPQVPAILLCQEYDELRVPSSPPRRLSRSSIDLRDLEAQHEREKIMTQNVSESVSSIYHCFSSQMLRYSESEPINANIKAVENQFGMKSVNNDEHQQVEKNQHQLSESKSSMNKISFMNNFDHSTTTREHDVNLISSASVIKDNHQINRTNSSSSNNGKKSFKKKMLASSDSDFFSLLRYNSVKLRRMNCFSIGSASGGGSNQAGERAYDVGGGGGGNSSRATSSNNGGNENKPQSMIYALSDSDFLIRVSDNNKRKIQAIVNKSDILNYLNKSFDHNLLDNNSAQHNHQKKTTDVECKKQFGDPDFFNVDKLKKVFEENPNESNSIVATDKLNKKETVSLPPLVNSTSNELNLKLNNSRSIDTVLLNIKNNSCNNDKNYTFKLLHDFSPKAINQEECLTRNLKDVLQRQSTNVTTSSGSDVDLQQLQPPNNNASNNNHSTLSVTASSAGGVDKNASTVIGGGYHLLKPVNLNDSLNGQQNVLLDLPSSIDRGSAKCCDSISPTYLDDKNIGKRKRTASNVTYNVNVIDFQSEDEPDGHHLGVSGHDGKRSNSSTSK